MWLYIGQYDKRCGHRPKFVWARERASSAIQTKLNGKNADYGNVHHTEDTERAREKKRIIQII